MTGKELLNHLMSLSAEDLDRQVVIENQGEYRELSEDDLKVEEVNNTFVSWNRWIDRQLNVGDDGSSKTITISTWS